MEPIKSPNFFLIAALILGFLLIWAASIALVSWDARRRKLTRLQRWLGIAIAVVLPVVGSLVYFMVLVIAWGMKAPPPTQEPPRHRETQPMPAFRLPGEGSLGAPVPKPRNTISAAEVVQPTIPFNTIEPAKSTRPTANRPVYQVSVVAGPHAGAEFRLNGFPTGIGRSSTAFVRLENDLKVSRRHAEIYEGPQGIHIRDLGSLQGTLVNGRPVQDQALRSGDQIQMGDSVLAYKVSGE
jgi:hypothetical protein